MHPTPVPFVPFVLSSWLMSTVEVGAGMSPWERWGIAGVFGFIAFLLWKRDETRSKAVVDALTASDAERLALNKEILQVQKDNAANIQSLLVASLQSTNANTKAMDELSSSITGIPCKIKRPDV